MELALLICVALCWTALGTGVIPRFVAWSQRGGSRSRDLDGAWQDYAWTKHYAFRPATGQRPNARSPRIEGRIDDVELVIEACSMTIGGAPRPCTRIWGRAAVSSPARVVVSSDPRLVQGPGIHDLEPMSLGDPFFDHALAVRASSGDAACRLLPPALRRALQGLLTSTYRLAMVLQLDDGEVSLTWLGEETRPAMLDEACAVVARACATPGHDAYR
ncbi:MAG TPA: hypothetical protein VIF15_22600 [Polyangiaceae bacterium]|jgi:hypothetical protein